MQKLIQSTGQTEAKGNGIIDLDDAPAGDDFLSRERALLGDDAAQFASTNDNHANIQADDDFDLLGGGDTYNDRDTDGEEVTEFESSYPAIDTRNDHMAPGGTITGSSEPFLPGQPQSSYGTYSAPEEEPDVIRYDSISPRPP